MTGAAPRLSRRAVLAGGAGLAAVACLAGGYELVRDGTLPGKYTLARMTGACGTALPRPAGPPPARREVSFYSAYRRRQVRMVTLIPAGAASPHGLGVMIGLHGAGGTAASMAANIAPSMTRARVTTFAIVCVDGGETYWHEHAGGDDPAGMIVHEVLPRAAAAGMRTARVGVGGESMGGFGALLIAERLASTSTGTGTSTGARPGRGTGSPAAAFVAALSPAVFATYDDARAANAAAFDNPANFARNNVFSGLPALRHVPAYVACGTDDPFAPETTRVRARLVALTRRPVPGGIMPGCHDSAFWGRHWPTALELMGPRLGGPAPGHSSAA
jgi:pimeloyl-ACP methyl ester carboxylesterase